MHAARKSALIAASLLAVAVVPRIASDARLTYRASFSEDLALAPGESPAKLAQWAIGASVGYEF